MSSELLESVLLGAVQGASEFLPISSSGHLTALELILGTDPGASLTRSVILHCATLLAVLVVFRDDVKKLLTGFKGASEGRRQIVLVLAGAIPAGVVGLLLRDAMEALPHRWPYVVPLCWLVTAFALWTLRRIPLSEDGRAVDLRLALWIGLWQVLALFPGISRSGITIAAALWAKGQRDAAASFSFLVSVPLILGATVLECVELFTSGSETSLNFVALAVGGGVAFGTGWLALTVFLSLLRRGALHMWSFYLVGVAIAFSVWLANGRLAQ